MPSQIVPFILGKGIIVQNKGRNGTFGYRFAFDGILQFGTYIERCNPIFPGTI